jgi:membrane fusion protein, copper/silver efflux system
MKKKTTESQPSSGLPGWHKTVLISAAVILFAAGFFVRGLFIPEPELADAHDHGAQAVQDQKETVWTCSMHPQVRRAEKGLCPLCNMDLIPLTDDGGDMEGVRRLSVSENAAGLMDIAVTPVERRFVSATVRMVGKVDYDETKLATITAWIPGRLDRLFVDYTGVPVRKGDHLVSLYSPELLSAQEELLQAIRAVENIKDSNLDIMRRTTEATLKAAREKLGLWGLTSEQIAEIEQRGTPADHMTIYAPSGGIVIHKNAMEGMYVKEGARIYTIADLSQVWVKLDAYESDLQWLRYGQTVDFTAVSYPGQVFTGTVAFIEPVLNAKTRTVKVRVNVPNADGRLKPDMFVKATVKAQVAAGGKVMDAALAGKWVCPMHPDEIYTGPGDCGICEMPLVTADSLGYVSDDPADAQEPLVIPVTAALVTGTRAIAYVQVPDTEKPTFEGREIVLGPRAGDYYLVRSGLMEGEVVVTRGNFKIDAELQIMAKPSMMTPGGGGGGGHDHHGGGDSSAQAGAPSIDIGPLSRHQLNQVLEAGKKVRTFLDRGDMDAVDAAFYGIQYSLNAVDANHFMGDAHGQWTELSMHINNDTVEGIDAHTPEKVRMIAQSLSQNLRFLEQRFGLGTPHVAHAGMTLSDELRTQLDALMQGYLSLQKMLADDSPAGAKKAAGDVQKAVMSVDMSLFSEDTHGKWMKALPVIKESLTKIADADDLQVQREGFFPLSQQMIGLSKTFGALGAGTVYIMHCPMAFDNRGASWLQDNEDLVNPYFGDMMLKCGTVEEVISKD